MKSNVITTLKNLIRIDSVNPFSTIELNNQQIGKGNETRIMQYLERKLKRLGFKITKQIVQKEIRFNNEKIISKRYNLLAEKGEGDSLLLMGHVDTVEPKVGWTTYPFEPIEKEGKIYGLGANDMKSGIALILESVKDFQPEGYKLKIAFVVDEEYWSFGTERLIHSDFLTDVKALLVPEVDDSSTNSEKQPIIIGRMGRTVYRFNLTGRSAHGAQARTNQEAVNAIHESIKLQNELIRYCQECKKEFCLGDASITNSAYLSHQSGGDETISIPDQASFILDRSFVYGENIDQEIEILHKFVRDCYERGILDSRVKVKIEEMRPTPHAEPYYVSFENSFLKLVTEKVDYIFGGHKYSFGYSVADENRIAKLGIPTIVLGPKGENCHAPNEWVDIENLKLLVETYREIIEQFNK
jgi:acetylornithine deacetylase/succinyl-diaminopimelate desuccinylase-like protein